MTEEKCITFCASKNYIYAGTEYSSECCQFKYGFPFGANANVIEQFVATPSRVDPFRLMNPIVTWPALATQLKRAEAQIGCHFLATVALPRQIQFTIPVLLAGLGKAATRTFIFFVLTNLVFSPLRRSDFRNFFFF